MGSNRIVKFVIVAAVLLLAAPFLMRLVPKPVTFDRARAALEKAGLTVSSFEMSPSPGQRAVAEADLVVNGINVSIYQFDNEGKIVTALEYQKKDIGMEMVQSMHLAQNLGAAVRKETPSLAARRGMFMMLATGEDQRMVERIIAVFTAM